MKGKITPTTCILVGELRIKIKNSLSIRWKRKNVCPTTKNKLAVCFHEKSVYACKSETRDVPTNLGGTKNKAHTGTDK